MVADGYPSDTEMRKNPPGAVAKHLNWEKRKKPELYEWRNLRKRLFAGDNDDEISNFEPFRPQGGPAELSMDNAQIEGLNIHLPTVVPTPGAVMNDAEREKLAEVDPELAESMATLDGENRAQVLHLVRRLIKEELAEAGAPKPKRKRDRKATKGKPLGPKPGSPVSQAQLDGLARGRATRAANIAKKAEEAHL